MAIFNGLAPKPPTEIGDPITALVAVSITLTVPLPALQTYAFVPSGLIAIALGEKPTPIDAIYVLAAVLITAT